MAWYASGAGDNTYNGLYTRSGTTQHGEPVYVNVNGRYLFKVWAEMPARYLWCMHSVVSASMVDPSVDAYYHNGATLPGTWYVSEGGVAPAPSLSATQTNGGDVIVVPIPVPGGYMGKVALGREGTWGDQSSVTAVVWPCVSQITANINHNPVETNCKVGDRGVNSAYATRLTVDGRLRFEVGPENVHKVLYWAHGAHAVAATLSGTADGATVTAYEHNIATNGISTPYSFAAWVDFGEDSLLTATVCTVIPGMFITGYDITIGDRSLLPLDVDYIAKSQALVTPTIPLVPQVSALQPFLAKEHLVTVELDGRTLTGQFVSGGIRYSTGVSAQENAGSRFITGGYAGRGRTEVNFTLDFEDVASVIEFMGSSPTKTPTPPVTMTWPRSEGVLRFRWESDEVAVYQAGTPHPYALEAYIPRFRYNAIVRELPEDGDAPVRVDVTGQGLLSGSATNVALRGDIVWRLVNRLSPSAIVQ